MRFIICTIWDLAVLEFFTGFFNGCLNTCWNTLFYIAWSPQCCLQIQPIGHKNLALLSPTGVVDTQAANRYRILLSNKLQIYITIIQGTVEVISNVMQIFLPSPYQAYIRTTKFISGNFWNSRLKTLIFCGLFKENFQV